MAKKNLHKFVKKSGLKSEQAFYKKYPNEDAYFQDHPEDRFGNNVDLSSSTDNFPQGKAGISLKKNKPAKGKGKKPSGNNGAQQQEMMQKMLQVVEQALSQGASPEQIVQQLSKSGVPPQQAQEIVQAVAQKMQQSQPQPQQEEQGIIRRPPIDSGQPEQAPPAPQNLPPPPNEQEEESEVAASGTRMPGRGQDMMQQIMQQVAQAIQGGANPEDIARQLVQKGVPEREAMAIVQNVASHVQSRPQPVNPQAQTVPSQNYQTPNGYQTPPQYGRNDMQQGASGISINPKHKGQFTAKAKRAGMGVQEFASHVLSHKNKYPTSTVKQANFAKNATKFSHATNGMPLNPTMFDPDYYKAASIQPINYTPQIGASQIFGSIPTHIGGSAPSLGGVNPFDIIPHIDPTDTSIVGMSMANHLLSGSQYKPFNILPQENEQFPYGTGSSALFEAGGSLTPAKAKKILKDNKDNGKLLTRQQQKYFGFVANSKKEDGGFIEEAKNGMRFSSKSNYDKWQGYNHAVQSMPPRINPYPHAFNGLPLVDYLEQGGGLSREADYGSSKHPYAMVPANDFAGPHRSYPDPTLKDGEDALRLARMHHDQSVISNVYAKYPSLKKGEFGMNLDDEFASGGKVHTIPDGTAVHWPYRSAIGHGTVEGVHKRGTTSANTEYSIAERDHHPGEPSVVYHYGSALRRGESGMSLVDGEYELSPQQIEYYRGLGYNVEAI